MTWVDRVVVPYWDAEFEEALYDRPLSEVFVEPSLSKLDFARRYEPAKALQNTVRIPELISGKENFLLCSSREFGRTTLLKYLARQVSKYRQASVRQIPVYLEHRDIKTGKDGLLRTIRSSLPPNADLPNGATLQQLLLCGQITLFIDDADPEDQQRSQIIKMFMSTYRKCRFFITLDSSLQPVMLNWSPEYPSEYTKVFIQPFRRSQLRNLVEKWTQKEPDDAEHVLNKVIEDISYINVPITPVTGSILLTIMGKEPDFAPINRTVVIRQFVEVLLGKHLPSEVLSETFDITNKNHFLANLAKYMVTHGKYTLPLAEVYDFSKQYMETFAFDYEPVGVVTNLVKARILQIKNNDISFKYRAFNEYYIALQMKGDLEFSDYILAEHRYLQFLNEIEYYAGMDRNDLDLANRLRSRLQELSNRMEAFDEWAPRLSFFDEFVVEAKDVETMATAIHASLGLPSLTNDQRDEILETSIPRDLGERQDIIRPQFNHDGYRYLVCLILYSRVVKNLENLVGEEKRDHVREALVRWSEYCAYLYALTDVLSEKRRALINGVWYTVGFGEDMSNDELMRHLLIAYPYSIADLIYEHLGTEKLTGVLNAPLTSNNSEEPAIVSFFRHVLLLDLNYRDCSKLIDRFVKTLPPSGVLLQTTLNRLRYIYRVGSPNRRSSILRVVKNALKRVKPHGRKLETQQIADSLEELKKQQLLIQIQDLGD